MTPRSPLEAVRRLSRRGFVGPRFEGFAGRVRFVWQELVWRRDVVLVAHPGDVPPASTVDPSLRLQQIDTAAGLAPIAAALDAAYYAGYTARLREPLAWGETLNVLWHESDVVAFQWHRRGGAQGVTYYAGLLLDGDCRIFRAGVLPAHRRRGYMKALNVLLAGALFRAGARRVFVEVTRDNLPSLRAYVAVGFRPVGEISVVGRLLSGWIRWEPRLSARTREALGTPPRDGGG